METLKQKLTHEAIRLFEKKGFVETSIQDIVEACGVTKGTFYYYFKSKAELLKDIQLDYINELISSQKAILNMKSDHKIKLKEMVSLLIKKIETHGASARVFFREMRHLPENELTVIIKKRDSIRYNLAQVIEKGVQLGDFRKDLNIDFITFGILGMCNWSYSWFHPDGPATDKELINSYVDLLLNGMAP